MKNRYKTPPHVRAYVLRQLENYKADKKLIKNSEKLFKEYEIDTRDLILAVKRVKQIDRVFNRLDETDREAATLIFIDGYSQQGAEIAKGLSKSAYYRLMDKIIYLTAREKNGNYKRLLKATIKANYKKGVE